ncbi:hypothetical protein FVEG_13538 [Fusarium verticillioides 7600]|uniref:Uncharacterized protein n=2 Tax=Fusarium TaxID=5506 RepID=W7MW83_GIBM7|nr:hypothetical protein FVEG_13538 [Fusarium verticillioides 7600]XP_044677299.1 hypothetical protein J7337_011196 [Fusarium musae]EWG55551.1 hypothetical protein FVEG_13538 [Fusarium verticillioides 7600]KAG9498299.1 hypothetical protein J7337_011196 [Fusarium musae]
MHTSNQPIALLPPTCEGLPSTSIRPSARQAEPGHDEGLTTDNEPPRHHLINRYWKVVFILTILLFVFTPARPAIPKKLDEDILLQMARRMNSLAVPCPRDLPRNIKDYPPPDQQTIATLAEFEKLPQEYLRQGHGLYCRLMNPDSPWSSDFRYIYALPEDIVRYLLIETNTSIFDEPIVAPIFERSRRIVLVEKERRRRLARIIERKIEELYIQKGLGSMNE